MRENEPLTTSEAARVLGVGHTTLKTWLAQFPIPLKEDSRGRRRLDDEAISLLESVKKMRDLDCGLETIRQRLGDESDSRPNEGHPQTDYSPTEVYSRPNEDRQQTTHGLNADHQAIVSEVVRAIAHQTEQGEKYAKAAHRIGELETTVRYLESDRDRLMALVSETTDHKGEADRLMRENEALRQEVERLKAKKWWSIKLW